jgi:hypothetical protein
MIAGLLTPKARKLTPWGASPVVGTRSRAIRAHPSTERRMPNAKRLIS